LCISFGVVFFLTLLYNHNLVLPIRQITSTFKQYEEGRLDLSTRLKQNREDEIGELVTLFNKFLENQVEKQLDEEALRESRDKLSAANAALEIASRLKDEFLASMSHELRTPLTGILGLSEALQLETYGALTEKQLKSIRNIEISGRHLLELINDILDLSKIEAGKLDMEFEPCSVADLCQASLLLTRGMAHQKRINISFSINPALINVRADPRRLKQMLVNLLSNAVKFTPERGNMGLDVQANDAEKAVFLSVWDKGIGIKPEEMGKLFKPFTQIDSSLARQYAGTGLGLSLVQRMAELHGGSIKVESTYGEGSRFTIILPWSTGVTQPVHGVKLGDTGPLLKKALVIEDNYLDAEHITRYLKEIGIASVVLPAIRGTLEQAATLCPGVILLDLNLPDGFGLDLLAQLKVDKRTRNIPVIITSVEERRTEALKLGAVGYLLKPFSQQDLRTELAKAAMFNTPAPAKPVMMIGAGDSAPLVLIADDNEITIDLVTDFLEANGYRVIATRSGYELLERAPELHPDIMLVDIQMPGLDGMETMRRVRAHRDPAVASTPMIAITALAMTGDREKCLQAGANEYMSKPIVLTRLVEQIHKILKK
jgi:signal transduction histidine kinase/CheY-like chemotaxis protein